MLRRADIQMAKEILALNEGLVPPDGEDVQAYWQANDEAITETSRRIAVLAVVLSEAVIEADTRTPRRRRNDTVFDHASDRSLRLVVDDRPA